MSEEQTVQLILLGDLNKFNFRSGEKLQVIPCSTIENAYKAFDDSISDSCYFNIIFSDFKTNEDGFKLLKYFIETNNKEKTVSNSSGYPFFMFLNNENFNKKILYSYYMENISSVKGLKKFLNIPSQNIIFCDNNVDSVYYKISKDISSYFFQRDFKENSDLDYSSGLNFIFVGNTGCGKSTFINYMIGKKRAFQALSNEIKSFKANKYSHTKYPISFNDTEGFETSTVTQKNKLDDNLKNNTKESLTNRTHIAFYLIPGPFDCNRAIDYSDIEILLELLYYKIHFYLIMTKEPNDNSEEYQIQVIKFIKQTIREVEKNKKPDRIKPLYKNDITDKETLIARLNTLKCQLEQRIFTIDVMFGSNDSIIKILKTVEKDLKEDMEIHNIFIKKAKEIERQNYKLKINISGEEEKDSRLGANIKKILNTPFFYLKAIKQIQKKEEALSVIKEEMEVSQILKLFFKYNSKIKKNRKEMFKKIRSIYSQVNINVNLDSELIEDSYSKEEKDSWYYKEKYTEQLGIKLIDIYEQEYQKFSDLAQLMFSCEEYNKSILQFSQYIKDIEGMKLNDKAIFYDVDLV